MASETIADIVAEKRHRADEIERDVSAKMASGKMVSDQYARELIADLRREAARIETAWERERAEVREIASTTILKERVPIGNAAAVREALANIAEYAKSALCHTEDSHVLGYLAQIENHANAALAAPSRNCDRFKTAEEAMEYHKRTNCAKRRYCAYRDGCPTDGSCLVNYLFATATISKGDTDGSK